MPFLKNFPAPTEGVHHCEPNTTAYFERKELGKGVLYISESVLCWMSSEGEGFSLSYPSIVIHAVSKDPNLFSKPCLLVILDNKITLDEEDSELTDAMNTMSVEEGQNGVDENDDEDGEDSTQIHFVPDNQEMLNTIYRALCDCQALHPEPGQSEDSEDGDGLVVAPSFNIMNGSIEDYEDNEEDDEMNEDQFEDAE